ncbi:MAG: metal ABC transporter ATP-binding protein [bacterium]
MSDNHPLVCVQDVDFAYGSTSVLSGISLDIKRGDFLAVIGPNGSGKTTLIKIILGILRPGSGQVKLFGQDIGGFSRWDKLGYVPQKASHIDPFFPVSAREVVAMGLLSGKKFPRLVTRSDEKAIDEALELVDMKKFKTRRIGELSGGQQQRIFIARAIVRKPDLLFLDEPTTGVDAVTQARFYDLLGSLNQIRNITIVLITHDIGVVNKYVNKVACLNQKLIFHGNHDEFCQSSVVEHFLRGEQHLICHRH